MPTVGALISLIRSRCLVTSEVNSVARSHFRLLGYRARYFLRRTILAVSSRSDLSVTPWLR